MKFFLNFVKTENAKLSFLLTYACLFLTFSSTRNFIARQGRYVQKFYGNNALKDLSEKNFNYFQNIAQTRRKKEINENYSEALADPEPEPLRDLLRDDLDLDPERERPDLDPLFERERDRLPSDCECEPERERDCLDDARDF